MKVAASILAFDFANIDSQLKVVEPEVDWLHYDVMDGHFVDNISFGPSVLKDVKKRTSLFIDTHLMLTEPLHYLERFIESGSDLITFHLEATDKDTAIKIINHLREKGIKVGMSIRPNTDPTGLAPYLDKINLVLVMSVEPGFGGQSFLPSAYDKVVYFNEYRKENKLNYLIEVDGGVNDKNATSLLQCGADVLVSGSYLVTGDVKENAARLRRN